MEFRNSESCAVCDVLDDDAAGGDEREGEADNIVITSVLPFISVDYGKQLPYMAHNTEQICL